MTKPKLPSRLSDAWDASFVCDQPRELRAVAARGGLVVANGVDLFMLRPGDQTWKVRPPPEDIGPSYAVAVEPRGTRRYAVATEKQLALFFKGNKGDEILRLTPQGPSPVVTQLAWGGAKGACALYILRHDATLLRMRPDLSDLDELDLGPIDALASDDNGVVAMVSLGEEPLVYITRDGAELSTRRLPEEIGPDNSVELVVADTAVAVVVDQKRVLVSRGPDDPFVEVSTLASPDDGAWTTGPIAFQGPTGDAALLCARWEGTVTRIIRAESSGAAVAVAEFFADGPVDAPEIAALSWDTSRSTLWGVSPDLGIIRAVAPAAKAAKKLLS